MAIAMGAPRVAMKKIICGSCGLINLEKFVTFPHCAACGAALPQETPRSIFDFWRRPISAPTWATLVGLCGAGIGILGITIARETSRVEEKQLVVYAQLSRQTIWGQDTPLQFVIDTTESSDTSAIREWKDVRLRLPRTTLKAFSVIEASPIHHTEKSGSGHYLVFDQVSRDEPIILKVRARRVGLAQLNATFYVRDFLPFTWRSAVQISRPQSAKVPNSRQFHSR